MSKAPQPTLAQNLERAAAIKHEMAALLRELEQATSGPMVGPLSTWRHHPAAWLAQRRRVGPPQRPPI